MSFTLIRFGERRKRGRKALPARTEVTQPAKAAREFTQEDGGGKTGFQTVDISVPQQLEGVRMTSNRQAHVRKHKLAAVACATLGLLATMPAFSADAEVEALKQELAAQRKLIEQLLANQK